jgi:hypothetical protein
MSLIAQLIALAKEIGVDFGALTDFLQTPFGATLAAVAVLTFISVRYFSLDLYEYAVYAWRIGKAALRRAFGIRTVLFFTDAGEGGALPHSLAHRLQSEIRKLSGNRVSVLTMSTGDELVHTPMLRPLVDGVVIVITDVTTLSNDQNRRFYLQKKLQLFVRYGGSVVVTHDALYRRSKNEGLQELGGCKIVNFRPVSSSVRYVRVDDGERVSENGGLLERLLPNFDMEDREVVWGNWSPGVEYLYVWADNPEIPLVTRRKVGRGAIFWCNTGDSDANGPPPSITRLDSEFIPLVAKLVVFGRK